jgi:hypothetical protein
VDAISRSGGCRRASSPSRIVVLSVIVPTAIAQRFFQPHTAHELARDQTETPVAPLPLAPARTLEGEVA